MVKRGAAPALRMRAVFISDIHLGFKGCSSDLLLDFLHQVEMDTLFLVGDIIDVWSMKKSMYWPQSHNNVLRTILGKAKRGTKVIFVPGNHDEVFRDFDGAVFGNLEIHREYVHRGADGRRMLVLHGDEFDSVVKCSPWLAKLGSNIYDILLAANPYINWMRRRLDLPHWSLSAYLKNKAKRRSRRRRASAASIRWSAATFIGPKCATSTGSCTATTATGSRAAPRSARI
jgi:UDP-2,3-diacylglucosamine pyrophosphatase LpxH